MTSLLKVVDGIDDSRNEVVTGSRVTSLAGPVFLDLAGNYFRPQFLLVPEV